MIVEIGITGTRPLLCHDKEKLANPMSEYSKSIKEITSKRHKTEADLIEIQRLEWAAGMYYSPELGPYMPQRCLGAMIRSAAKKKKMGKIIQESLMVLSDVPINYDGPRDMDEMWKSGEFLSCVPAKVNQNLVMRSRPIFREWSINFDVDFEETLLNERDLQDFMEVAGNRLGLCDWRPTYGRFQITRFEAARIAA